MSVANNSSILLRADFTDPFRENLTDLNDNLSPPNTPPNAPPNTPHAEALKSSGFGTPLASSASSKKFTFSISDKSKGPTAVAVNALKVKGDALRDELG